MRVPTFRKAVGSTHPEPLPGMKSVRNQVSRVGLDALKSTLDNSSETAVHNILRQYPELLRNAMPKVGHHGMWYCNKPQIRPPLPNGKQGKIPDMLLAGRGSDGMAWFVVELKSPSAKIFNQHGNAFSPAANQGLNQLAAYLHYANEKQASIRESLEIPHFRTPAGILIIGREQETIDDEVKEELKAFWNRTLDTIKIISYDNIVRASEQRLGSGT
jgi:hypothetical protein